MPAPPQFTTLMVHKVRAEQLRKAGKAHGISAAEKIDELIALGIEHGAIDDDLPYFRICPKKGEGVEVTLDDVSLPLLRPELAHMLANVIRHHIGQQHRHISKPGKLSDGSMLMIGRSGRGMVITRLPEPGATVQKVGLTISLARDVARLVDKAADEAETLETLLA